jgi:putative CocE/NonD family hydrolase
VGAQTRQSRVREIENAWIVLGDGCRLAARIWLPEDAGDNPVPALLEYLPYRKNDGTVGRDAIACPFVAGHGYAYLRVDLRGSGDSDGVIEDEYTERELGDCLEVIAWIAGQAWCSGDVGMVGISWGGFNALQVAALRPPALKAVITLCSTDDRYADDIHYMGGCLLNDNVWWAAQMFQRTSLPPDPRWVGDRWREMWIQRLEKTGHWLIPWLEHPHRDAYWEHGSVCEDFGAIVCPVYAVGGWADGYSNAVFRLLAGLRVPRKGLVGPWAHRYPDMGRPGPAIGFLKESIRWWDHWLKGRDTGIMDEPMLRVWMQESVPPRPDYDQRPGRWIAETDWPSPRILSSRFSMRNGKIEAGGNNTAGHSTALIASPLATGLAGGRWCGFGKSPDLPWDQRLDDGGSLVYDSAPLDDDLEILGAPVAELALSADRPIAMVAVRLSDLRPDGSVTRVTYGLLNLTQRHSRERPAPLEPGKRYTVRVQLNDAAHRFPRAHRIRLALSSSYWPIAWPPPVPAVLSLDEGASAFHLPVRPDRDGDSALAPFAAAETASDFRKTQIAPPAKKHRVVHDLAGGETRYEVLEACGRVRHDDSGLEVVDSMREQYRCRDGDASSVEAEVSAQRGLSRGDWSVRTETLTRLSSDGDSFRMRASLKAYEGNECLFEKEWDRTLPRRLL